MDGYASELVIEEVIKLLEYPEMHQGDDVSIEDLLTARQHRASTVPLRSTLCQRLTADNAVSANIVVNPAALLPQQPKNKHPESEDRSSLAPPATWLMLPLPLTGRGCGT